MPAGDLIVADYQVEVRLLLTGAGTSYRLGEEGIEGLGEPEAKTHDADLGHDHGAFLCRDYTGVRIVTIPYLIKSTAATAGTLFVALSAAWASSETDIELHVRLPGFGQMQMFGRPRGLLCDASQQKHGLIRAFATFVCGDPTITIVPP